jgi:type IV pilus assembly protein PilW
MKRTLRRAARLAGVPRRGLTLIELLVAIVLGMLLSAAIAGVLVRQENARRVLTSSNDALLNGAHVTHLLDRALRGAGSGFTQAWQSAYGCQLTVARGGSQLLPRATAWPAPFDTVSSSPRLAPVIVHAGAGAGGSDVIAVASGNSGLGELPLRALAGSITGASVRVPATVGLRQGDLVLLVERGGTDCAMQQAAVGFVGGNTQQIDFGADYSASTIGSLSLTSLGSTGEVSVLPMGNAAGSPPFVFLMGIGANRTLMGLDMLRLGGGTADTVTALADGVIELRVRYGIDTNNDRIVDQWVRPTATPWTAAELQDGSAAAQERLRNILAVRVGVIMRTASGDKDAVSPASYLLFSDLDAALQHTHSLSGDEQRYRHRVMEFTVPLRNVMLI